MKNPKFSFKTSYIAVLIRILLEFNCFFNLQNVAKKLNSFQYKLEVGLYSWGGGGGGGIKTRSIFFFKGGWGFNGGRLKGGGGGGGGGCL